MSRCTACGASYRTGKRVLVARGNNLVGALVCPACASRALLILTHDEAGRCDGCGKADHPPKFCATCADERALAFHQRKQKLDAGVAKVRATIEAYKRTGGPNADDGNDTSDYREGRIDGLEQALSLLEDGR